jgi:hypothetical protein
MILSRFPVSSLEPPGDSPLRRVGTYLAFARVWLPDGMSTDVVSVHASPREAKPELLGEIDRSDLKRPDTPAVLINDFILYELKAFLTGRFIAGGDWNTGLVQAKPRAGKAFFEAARSDHWFDCVHERRGEDELQTWFREGDLLKQDDHVFCDRDLGEQMGEPWVARDAAEHLGLSDHAPLVLDFDVPRISHSFVY